MPRQLVGEPLVQPATVAQAGQRVAPGEALELAFLHLGLLPHDRDEPAEAPHHRQHGHRDDRRDRRGPTDQDGGEQHHGREREMRDDRAA
ncbi:hypothetical protein LRS13_12855 [Svornostia abyssi]|uniref:Uncharacterized protein n=1 Tax=Svornostia abyssi TaxID=2898438 RepID=A0ABY5PAJ2_9ACTN|nr:hypothetical protein LRS13_12855 [Parviterribacteraceae bacterium J379]